MIVTFDIKRIVHFYIKTFVHFNIDIFNKEMELERNALMLYPFIKKLVISHGRAAEILGIPKWKLIEVYAQLGIPYLDMSDDKFQKELANAERLAAYSSNRD